MWQANPDGHSFITAAEQAGYIITQRDDQRPFRVITPEGNSVDLVRQLDGIKTKEVHDRLQPIRADLWPEVDALQRAKPDSDRVQFEPKKSDNAREMSDSQDMAEAMINKVKKEKVSEKRPLNICSYSFTIKHTPALSYHSGIDKIPLESAGDISDSQDRAAAMIEWYRQRQVERQRQEPDGQE